MLLFCGVGTFCLACGQAKSASTTKNLSGRRRRPGSQETFEKPYARKGLLAANDKNVLYLGYASDLE